MATLTELEKKQIAQAEEILFSGEDKEGFCKDLFFGKFREESIMPFPELSAQAEKLGDEMLEQVQKYCDDSIDPDAIDRNAMIPDDVVRGLGDIGVLGLSLIHISEPTRPY